MKNDRKFIFGPVLSRRLGRSLGIDTVPLKTCTYDCVYCQLGRTAGKKAEIKKYTEWADIADELKESLVRVEADYITLSGSGEPTLNSATGDLIANIKKITDIPICVITNGSLLSNKNVRKSLLDAELVIPSLDAGDEKTHDKINRPHDSINFREMTEGIESFAREFRGDLRLEIMLVKGINDSESELKKIRPFVNKIAPGEIQINTVVRPPACPGAEAAGNLALAKEIFGEKASIIADHKSNRNKISVTPAAVMGTISRRPSTAEDIAAYLGLNINEALKHITRLLEEKSIISEPVGEKIYYKPKR